jgi:hypothetical protein
MMVAANAAVAERLVAAYPAAALLRNHPVIKCLGCMYGGVLARVHVCGP